MMITGLIRYHYPVSVTWVSEKLMMGHFSTVSRAMHIYDGAKGDWKKKKRQILEFIVAVGTPLSGCPPHRSVRAELPHTAPTSSI